MELLIAVNPDADSGLSYLMRLPLAGGMVFRTSGTWPRANTGTAPRFIHADRGTSDSPFE